MTSTQATRPEGVRATGPVRLAALDGLRFLAAASVVLYHLTARLNPGIDGRPADTFGTLSTFSAWGSVGAQVFFVISGFVILLTAWKSDLPRFAASRVSRLFPAYWVSVLINAAIIGVLWTSGFSMLGGREPTVTQVLANLTMLQQPMGQPDMATSYWTLWIELLFYLLVALLMRRHLTRNRVLAVAFLWPLAGLLVADVPVLSTVLISQWSPFFAGGMALYVLYRFGHSLLPWLLVGYNAVLGVLVVVPFQAAILPADAQLETDDLVAGLLAVATFALVALVTLTPLSRLRWRWLTFLGALTYPVFLIHETVGWAVLRAGVPALGSSLALIAALGAVLVAALALHYLVEKPFGPRLRRAVLNSLDRGDAQDGAGAAIPAPEAVAPALPAPVDPQPVPVEEWAAAPGPATRADATVVLDAVPAQQPEVSGASTAATATVADPVAQAPASRPGSLIPWDEPEAPRPQWDPVHAGPADDVARLIGRQAHLAPPTTDAAPVTGDDAHLRFSATQSTAPGEGEAAVHRPARHASEIPEITYPDGDVTLAHGAPGGHAAHAAPASETVAPAAAEHAPPMTRRQLREAGRHAA